jgi:hypothetical protein
LAKQSHRDRRRNRRAAFGRHAASEKADHADGLPACFSPNDGQGVILNEAFHYREAAERVCAILKIDWWPPARPRDGPARLFRL